MPRALQAAKLINMAGEFAKRAHQEAGARAVLLPIRGASHRMPAAGPVPLPDTLRQACFDFLPTDGMLGRLAALPPPGTRKDLV